MPKDNKNNKTYSTAEKARILTKLLNNESVSKIEKEEGIPKSTLTAWKTKACKKDGSNSGQKVKSKFQVVLETTILSEYELSEYCRKNGLFVEEVKKWRAICETSMEKEPEAVKEIKEELIEEKKKNKQLEKELNRKDKALAEAAALLVLQKKLKAFWEEEEGL